MDLLTPTLNTLRLRAAALGAARLQPPWSLRVPAAGRPVLHALTVGSARLSLLGGGALDLDAGDLVLVADGCEHTLHDRGPVRGDERWWLQAWQRGWAGRIDHGGNAAESRLVSAAFDLTGSPTEPLLRLLPPLVQLRGCPRPGVWLEASLAHLEPRIADARPAAATIVDRLVEIALVDGLRTWVERPGGATLVRDARIARTLLRIHDEEGADCTLPGLAEAAGMSRAAFCERFRELVGESPGRYVQRCRMRRAAQWLAGEGLTPKEAAARLGYSSADAFARAFKRELGVTPGAWPRDDAAAGRPCCTGSADPDERR